MQGDNLAVLLFAWGLAVTFFLEGRKESGWRHYLFWVMAAVFAVAGPLWPALASVWPAAADAGRSVGTNPQSWFFALMFALTVIAITGKHEHPSDEELGQMQMIDPTAPDRESLMNARFEQLTVRLERMEEHDRERFAGTAKAMKEIWEKINALAAAPPKPKTTGPTINWAIWRQMTRYRIYELARILAGANPAIGDISSPEVAGYLRAIFADIADRKLPYVRAYDTTLGGRQFELEVDESTEIKREDALAWARAKGFPCDHVE